MKSHDEDDQTNTTLSRAISAFGEEEPHAQAGWGTTGWKAALYNRTWKAIYYKKKESIEKE